jgi:phospholipase/carboxylesterase
MPGSVCIQQPETTADQLILLFHGVGASSRDMVPVGQQLARALPGAFIVSVDAPRPSDMGMGRQWFSVRGITEDCRPARVAAVMPEFQAAVRHWQGVTNSKPAATLLLGFSQGAIMALESTQVAQAVAGRVVAVSGRFAEPPRSAASGVPLNLIHGEQDPVIACGQSIEAAKRLQELGADVTLDLLPSLGHGIDGRAMARILARIADRAHASP